jgi:hypothetical protein
MQIIGLRGTSMMESNKGSLVNRQKTDSELFKGEYWDKVFLKLLMRVGIFAITVIIIGVLATPIIMSVVYTWMWMFLYSAYLLIIFIALALDRR